MYFSSLIRRSTVRQIVRRVWFVEKVIQIFLRKYRVNKFKQFIEQGLLWPDSKDAIVDDYSYSIKNNFRGPSQVINIELLVRLMQEKKLVGSVVETGVWTGGASAFLLKSLVRNIPERVNEINYWGFDSFEGMPSPTSHDGEHGLAWLYGKKESRDVVIGEQSILQGHEANSADFAMVLNYLKKTDFPANNINLIKGWFQNTIKNHRDQVGPIALLRLDADFYEATTIAMDLLYDNVIPGGIVIVDDYGGFQGCRLAIDEFFSRRSIPMPLLWYADDSIRFFIKD